MRLLNKLSLIHICWWWRRSAHPRRGCPCSRRGRGRRLSLIHILSFDGDYVNLRRTDIESDELNPVALALLPPEIDVGSKLKCEYFQYEIIG